MGLKTHASEMDQMETRFGKKKMSQGVKLNPMITVTRNLQRARHQLDLFDKDQSKLEEFDEEYEQLSFLSE